MKTIYYDKFRKYVIEDLDGVKSLESVKDEFGDAEYEVLTLESDEGYLTTPQLHKIIPPSQTYQELRAYEYNRKTLGEQFGMQYDDAKFGTTTWIDWQDEIKLRIPKP
jgi:hypothetical protein